MFLLLYPGEGVHLEQLNLLRLKKFFASYKDDDVVYVKRLHDAILVKVDPQAHDLYDLFHRRRPLLPSTTCQSS